MKKKRSRGRGYGGRKGRPAELNNKWEAKAMRHLPTFTPQLLKLFVPRPPLPPSTSPPPLYKEHPPYTGLAQFVCNFADPGDPEYAPSPSKPETPSAHRAHIHALRLEQGAQKAALDLEKYDPHHDPSASGDPFKTLFVANISFETTDHKLKREFQVYGPIKHVRIVQDSETGKPKGYAFIEFLRTHDMRAAYKRANGKKIDGRRVIVDVERGRTVRGWRPRRLGGGLGCTRIESRVNEESVGCGPDHSNGDASREYREMDPRSSHQRDAYDEKHVKVKNRVNDTSKFHNEHHRKRVLEDDLNQHDNYRRAYLHASGSRRTHGDDWIRYDHDRKPRDRHTRDCDGKLANGDGHHCDNNAELTTKRHSRAFSDRYRAGDDNIGQDKDDINKLRINEMEL